MVAVPVVMGALPAVIEETLLVDATLDDIVPVDPDWDDVAVCVANGTGENVEAIEDLVAGDDVESVCNEAVVTRAVALEEEEEVLVLILVSTGVALEVVLMDVALAGAALCTFLLKKLNKDAITNAELILTTV